MAGLAGLVGPSGPGMGFTIDSGLRKTFDDESDVVGTTGRRMLWGCGTPWRDKWKAFILACMSCGSDPALIVAAAEGGGPGRRAAFRAPSGPEDAVMTGTAGGSDADRSEGSRGSGGRLGSAAAGSGGGVSSSSGSVVASGDDASSSAGRAIGSGDDAVASSTMATSSAVVAMWCVRRPGVRLGVDLDSERDPDGTPPSRRRRWCLSSLRELVGSNSGNGVEIGSGGRR